MPGLQLLLSMPLQTVFQDYLNWDQFWAKVSPPLKPKDVTSGGDILRIDSVCVIGYLAHAAL